MSVIPQSSRASRGLRPWAPYQGSALYPLGTLSGPQTPHLLTPPLTTNPGSAPVDGKIFVRNNRELVTTITTDYGLKRYILDNFSNAMEFAYPPAKEPRASNIPPQFQSYFAAVLPGGSGP